MAVIPSEALFFAERGILPWRLIRRSYEMIGPAMKLRWSPLRLALIGLTLLLGSVGWFFLWWKVNPPSPALSDGPTPPLPLGLAAWAGLLFLFCSVVWAIARWRKKKKIECQH